MPTIKKQLRHKLALYAPPFEVKGLWISQKNWWVLKGSSDTGGVKGN